MDLFQLPTRGEVQKEGLNPDVETVFMMPGEAYTYLSSRLVKEVFALGGVISGLVPDAVEALLRKR